MNRALAEAIIAAFSDDEVKALRQRFAPFDERDWMRCERWLHESGLALYFLARAKSLGIEGVMPARTVNGLEADLGENRERTQSLFYEFVKVNMEFQRARLSYANLNGFSLVPRSCADPVCRYQRNLDFLVARRNSELCRQALERQGYRLTAVSAHTWEFRAAAPEAESTSGLYQVKRQRSLEVNLAFDQEQGRSDADGDRLSRLQLQVWNGFEFPALSECDKFLAQGMHLFKQFQTEWTRASWMLEYATAIHAHRHDESFWTDVVSAIELAPETRVGVGVASLITSRTLGVLLPAELLSRTLSEIPEQARLWIDRYEYDVMLADYPGSKLYLLLRDALWRDAPVRRRATHARLFPLHRKDSASARSGMWRRARGVCARIGFLWTRLRFHVAEGLRYRIEAARWKSFCRLADLTEL
jgi:hypothetical protein